MAAGHYGNNGPTPPTQPATSRQHRADHRPQQQRFLQRAVAAELCRPATAAGRRADGLQPAARRSLRLPRCRAALGLCSRAGLRGRANSGASRRRITRTGSPAYFHRQLPRQVPAVARASTRPRSGGKPARGRGRRSRRPVQQSRAHDGSHAHRRPAARSAGPDLAGRNANGPADVRRGRELRCRPGGQHHARRTELRLDESAHQLGRHHGRPRLPRRGRAVPLGTGARHPGPALHDQLPGAVPERISR